MKYFFILKRILIISILYFVSCVYSMAQADYFKNHHFYYGIEAGKLKTSFQNGYGSNFFDSDIADYNLFFGAQGNCCFGFEAGIGKTPEKTKQVNIVAGNTYPGTNNSLTPGQSQTWDTTIKLTSGYGGINWFKTLGKLSVFGLIGFEVTKFQLETQLKASTGTAPTLVVRNYDTTKAIPMWKLGLHYNFAAFWGLRANFTWHNYSRVNPLQTSQPVSAGGELKLDNSASWFIGVFLQM